MIRIEREVLALLLEEARKHAERESCGLLAGRDGVITRAFPATNVAQNRATSYEIAPREIFHRMREMRAAGLELLGIYHSHPNGKNEPSPRDVELAYYPNAAYFIISPLTGSARPVRAFSIRGGRVAELKIQGEPAKENHDRSA